MTPDHSELPHVIICGNVLDGFELYGPFPDAAAAIEHANTDPHLPDTWIVAQINPLD